MTELALQEYQFGDMKLIWLRGVDKMTDAGTLFGPVPKVVWSRYYPTTEENMMVELTDPILIQYKNKNYLILSIFFLLLIEIYFIRKIIYYLRKKRLKIGWSYYYIIVVLIITRIIFYRLFFIF